MNDTSHNAEPSAGKQPQLRLTEPSSDKGSNSINESTQIENGIITSEISGLKQSLNRISVAEELSLEENVDSHTETTSSESNPVKSMNKAQINELQAPFCELDLSKNDSGQDGGSIDSQIDDTDIALDSDIPLSDSDDEFISSDNDSLSKILSGKQFNSLGCGSTFSEHVLYFEKALDVALDSHQLDKSLVAQAKLSGHLNDTNRILIEKQQELTESLERLRHLFKHHIASKRIDDLDTNLRQINTRIRNLKHGPPKTLFFGKSKLGVMDKYPVEYNQARDKVLDRPEEQ
ncbi:hypothetical protein PUMCH_001073 [Australozyma saopauloensis]|uniref:Biogenesis of lysosome-related organelles complex 1 subunit KXD1 n=1 Tax=Australozyma saopauloensis TaxID=291208 RepID=A0AAX4H6H1_9ASCO|nr:hypothetical protein PUMCH_001073 [[Candida] saopauloensis]